MPGNLMMRISRLLAPALAAALLTTVMAGCSGKNQVAPDELKQTQQRKANKDK